jgi:hypothetical protein
LVGIDVGTYNVPNMMKLTRCYGKDGKNLIVYSVVSFVSKINTDRVFSIYNLDIYFKHGDCYVTFFIPTKKNDSSENTNSNFANIEDQDIIESFEPNEKKQQNTMNPFIKII